MKEGKLRKEKSKKRLALAITVKGRKKGRKKGRIKGGMEMKERI